MAPGCFYSVPSLGVIIIIFMAGLPLSQGSIHPMDPIGPQGVKTDLSVVGPQSGASRGPSLEPLSRAPSSPNSPGPALTPEKVRGLVDSSRNPGDTDPGRRRHDELR